VFNVILKKSSVSDYEKTCFSDTIYPIDAVDYKGKILRPIPKQMYIQ